MASTLRPGLLPVPAKVKAMILMVMGILLTVLLLAPATSEAAAATDATRSAGIPGATVSGNTDFGAINPGAGISVVNGRPARISKWPWQVAIAVSQKKSKPRAPRRRTFCGGTLIAPDLVLTAGHCVAEFKRADIRKLEVISGRTWLNNRDAGEVVPVRRRVMPVWPNGRPRYREMAGGSIWDVAILRLARPVTAEPIRLAGQDEYGSWAPGQITWTTGWGLTNPESRLPSPRLRVTSQVMLEGRVCRAFDRQGFKVRTMNCLGGPGGNASSCSGDSGGPLVAQLGSEYRLVGLTSSGDPYCRGAFPSVDTRVAGKPVRDWVARAALAISGVDVVGSGGEITPARTWCRVPRLYGLNLRAAGRKLRESRCRLGKVQKDFYARGRRGRIVGASRFAGWLAPRGARVKVWLPG